MNKKSASVAWARLVGSLFALIFVVTCIAFIVKSVFVNPETAQSALSTTSSTAVANSNAVRPHARPNHKNEPTLTLTSLENPPPKPHYGFYEELKKDENTPLMVRDFTKEYEARVRERKAEIEKLTRGKGGQIPKSALGQTVSSRRGGSFWVQVLSGPNEKGAEYERDKLIKQGYPASVQARGNGFAVLLGPYEQEEAKALQAKFKNSIVRDLGKAGAP